VRQNHWLSDFGWESWALEKCKRKKQKQTTNTLFWEFLPGQQQQLYHYH